jgi:hypothetical protein
MYLPPTPCYILLGTNVHLIALFPLTLIPCSFFKLTEEVSLVNESNPYDSSKIIRTQHLLVSLLPSLFEDKQKSGS